MHKTMDTTLTEECTTHRVGGLSRLTPARLSLALCLIVLLTRSVFIRNGYGSHSDEWRVVHSGVIFWLDGIYVPSRQPGYPFNELIMGGAALLGGPWLCAALSTLASMLTVVLFAHWLRTWVPDKVAWPSLAFALHPWFWASGITALDPVWGLGLFLGALISIQRRSYVLAGLACGLAVGFRPTAAAWGTLFFAWTLYCDHSWQAIRNLIAGAAIPCALAALLLLSSDDYVASSSGLLDSLRRVDARSAILATYRAVEFFGGIPGAVTLAAIVGLRISAIRAFFAQGFDIAWPLGACSVVFLAQFLIISDKPEYLFPILPFFFLVMAFSLHAGDWIALLMAFATSAFISIDVGSWQRNTGAKIDIGVAPGYVLQYMKNINEQTAETVRLSFPEGAHDLVVRNNLDRRVFAHSYTLALLHSASQPEKTRTARPRLFDFYQDTQDEPVRIRAWSDSRNSNGSRLGLYDPETNTLLVQAGVPLTDHDLLALVGSPPASAR